MSIVLRRALMREIGDWATKPVGKICTLILAFVAIAGAMWLTKAILDAGSLVALGQQLKALLGSRVHPIT